MARTTRARAQDLLDGTPCARWWGLTALDLGEGRATAGLGARPEFPRPGRVQCYEVIADRPTKLRQLGFAEAPGTPPCGSPSWPGSALEAMAVTVEMKASFLRGAADLALRAEVLRPGRRIAFGEPRTTAEDGVLVAHSALGYVRPAAG